MWVGGKEQPGSDGELIPIEDPATGEIFAHCHAASPADVHQTIALAQHTLRTHPWWRLPSSRHQRADILDACAALLTTSLPALIPLEVRQTGRPIREMRAQVPSLVRWFRYYASLLRTESRPVLPTMGKLHNFLDHVPLGVVVQITPFNHPLLIAVKKIAPALAAGNCVVVKPSELTPLTTLLLGRILQQAGVPDGVFSVLPGYGATTGKELVSHPLVRKVDVTGGTAAGRAIGAIAGGNLAKYTAELGGKAPLVVFDRASVDLAVNGIVFGSFVASGQTCIASTRIIVHNSVMGEVLEKLRAKIASITRRIGQPGHEGCMMGPLVSGRQFGNVQALVDAAVASGKVTALVGGRRMTGTSELDGSDLGKGWYYEPTLLVSAESASSGGSAILETRVWREEAFGPVICVVGFDTEQQAVELANDSEFGLGAGIWTTDLSQAFRVAEQIDAGITWVNTHHRNDPSSPWGGAKSASGVGSENGIDAYHAYTTIKSTIINYASTEESLAADDWFKEGDGNVRYG
ncbi:aldehyde dehydrogenase [Microdochium bolleyi]|uniref:aldehyde dehydrogenase (NAD(+)) n=1 Tax=Microdochium bolleyi TaxID=196109 RepID=A0A136ITV1_9PEZI|nr:aldehyde dehydrogenase [Microdochium bolleyi]